MMNRRRGILALFFYFLGLARLSQSVGLAFDNQLAIIANDCYTRISIGSKLPDADVSFSAEVTTVSDCEEECSRRTTCNTFSFGIGVRGNATCALSSKMPKPEELQANPDYDVYVRSQRTPHCKFDQLYKIGTGSAASGRTNETRPITRFGSGLMQPIMPNTLQLQRPGNDNGRLPTYRNGAFGFSSYDDDRRITDIVRNKYRGPHYTNPIEAAGFNNFENFDDTRLSLYSPETKPFLNRKLTFGQRLYSNKENDRQEDFDLFPFRGPSTVHQPILDDNRNNKVFSKPIQVLDTPAKVNDKPSPEFGSWMQHGPDGYPYNNRFNNQFTRNFGSSSIYQNQGWIPSNFNVNDPSRNFYGSSLFNPSGRSDIFGNGSNGKFGDRIQQVIRILL